MREQYRMSITFYYGFGLYVKYEPSKNNRSVSIFIPFVEIYIGLTREANGINFNGSEI